MAQRGEGMPVEEQLCGRIETHCSQEPFPTTTAPDAPFRACCPLSSSQRLGRAQGGLGQEWREGLGLGKCSWGHWEDRCGGSILPRRTPLTIQDQILSSVGSSFSRCPCHLRRGSRNDHLSANSLKIALPSAECVLLVDNSTSKAKFTMEGKWPESDYPR